MERKGSIHLDANLGKAVKKIFGEGRYGHEIGDGSAYALSNKTLMPRLSHAKGTYGDSEITARRDQ